MRLAGLQAASLLRPSPLSPAGGADMHDLGQHHLWEKRHFS